jgi:integral membrane protein (TIGR01906 family)
MSFRLSTLLVILLTLALPPFIILSNLYIVMNPAYVYFEYGRPDFPPADRYDLASRTANSVATVRFVRGEIPLDTLKGLGVYNEREIKHLVDVQVVASRALMAHALLGFLILLALVVLLRSRETRALAPRGLLNGAILTLAFFGAVGLFALVAFNAFFVVFHRLFFEGDTWLFAYSDSLIQFYPIRFWEDAAYILVGGAVIEAIVIGVGAYVWLRRAR